MNKQYYFNITYACNNDCIICASNSYKEHNKSSVIDLQKFKDIAYSRNIGFDDIVVINGGEPTVHPCFEEIINVCKKKKIFTYLFTNGKKFANKIYTEKILKNFRGRIAIPFYSHLEEIHDKITNSSGSFKATIKGLKNINDIIINKKNEMKEIDIELKTLVLRSNMNELVDIASFLLENFQFEHFLISSTHISKKAQIIGFKELVKLSYCSSQIRECLDYFTKKSNIETHCYFIPLCIFGNIKYEKTCSHSCYKSDRECDFYFDPNHLNGIKWTSDKRLGHNCLICKYYIDCMGVWKSYYNYFGSNELIPFL